MNATFNTITHYKTAIRLFFVWVFKYFIADYWNYQKSNQNLPRKALDATKHQLIDSYISWWIQGYVPFEKVPSPIWTDQTRFLNAMNTLIMQRMTGEAADQPTRPTDEDFLPEHLMYEEINTEEIDEETLVMIAGAVWMLIFCLCAFSPVGI